MVSFIHVISILQRLSVGVDVDGAEDEVGAAVHLIELREIDTGLNQEEVVVDAFFEQFGRRVVREIDLVRLVVVAAVREVDDVEQDESRHVISWPLVLDLSGLVLDDLYMFPKWMVAGGFHSHNMIKLKL